MTAIDRPTELVLIRHEESQRNQAKKGSVYFADDEARQLIKGVPDYEMPVTERGHSQGLQTGVGLRKMFGVPDYLYHSGYVRTIETGEDILAAYTPEERENIKVRMNPFIRERDAGYAYDMTQEEAETAFPWLQDHWKTFGGFFARPPGGLSLSDVAGNVYNFINMLFRDRAGQKVFVVTHGGTLRAFRFILERWTYEQALRWPEGDSPHNCGITHYKYDAAAERLVLQNYNTVLWSQ